MNDNLHTDVLVLGGGASGVAAAVAAARSGLKVVLVEKNDFLGGKATAAEVGTICGLYTFSLESVSAYITGGFARDFAEELRRLSGTAPLHSAVGLHYLPYSIPAFKKLCDELMEANGVQVLLQTILTRVDVAPDHIRSVSLQHGEQEYHVTVKAVIDCSGESRVGQLAGLPLIRSNKYQAAAQVFTMAGIEETHEGRLGLILMKELSLAIRNKKLPHYADRVYVVQGSLRDGQANLKIGIPLPVTHTSGNLEALHRKAHEFIRELTGYLVQEVAAFQEARVTHIAPEVGIRVGLRTEGKYVLTEEDVLGCRKFEDAIAQAAWPVEEWDQDRRVHMRYFEHDNFYQLPARCLHAGTVDNLFMAGRNLSATDGAIASARVIGICLQTGYAAGLLAAGQLQGLPEQEVIQRLQSEFIPVPATQKR